MNLNINTEFSNEAHNPLLRVGAVMPSCFLKSQYYANRLQKISVKLENRNTSCNNGTC
jgi:hypothetical protein